MKFEILLASSILLLTTTETLAQTISQSKEGNSVPKTIWAIPVQQFAIADCPQGPKSPEIIIKFSGIRIDPDGNLKLKRNIRFKSNAGDNEGPQDIGDPVPEDPVMDTSKTPFDISIVSGGNTRYIPIKVVLRKGVGAKFIPDPDLGPKYAYIRAGKDEGKYFCGLSEIVEKADRYIFRFFVIPKASASYALGILVPEVNVDGVWTSRYLPLIIDPNVRNQG